MPIRATILSILFATACEKNRVKKGKGSDESVCAEHNRVTRVVDKGNISRITFYDSEKKQTLSLNAYWSD